MSRAASAQLFPVRHHSPRACAVLAGLLERVDPELVLVEGPADGGAMIPILTSAETVPPVALLAYRTDGQTGSCAWPFVAYSPEYVAIRWAAQRGRTARFIDITSGQSLAHAHADEEEQPALDPPSGIAKRVDPASDAAASPYHRIAERAGFRSFEEFWEARFEAPAHGEPGFRAALLEFAETVRHDGARVDYHRARDAVMQAAIDAAIDEGADPRRVVAVLGAAHAAAIAAGDVDPRGRERFGDSVSTQITVIPYSFPRIAEQTGYGAGNRAPFFHQRAHDAGADYQRATLEVLVDFTDHLRLRGFGVSLADTIEAYRLACRLAELRGKSGPGIDEVREATVATLCRGEGAHVDGFLWSTVVGKGIGRVAPGVGRSSLQEEFWRLVERFGLPKTDEPETVSLRLADAVHVEISVLLHRLRVLDVPYAALAMTKKSRSGDAEQGLKTLSRVREGWQCQWTPSTEIALVERVVLGESLRAATERRLGARLGVATTAGGASDVLVDGVLTSAPGAVSLALAACERLSATDDDLASLATACRALAGLVAYGSSRESLGVDDAVLAPLLARTFARATLRLRPACVAAASDAPAITEAMRVLQEIALTHDTVDGDAWLDASRDVARSFDVHPRTAGSAAALLLLARRWDDAELAGVLGLRLSATAEPDRTADFLAGFLEQNALALVKSETVVGIVDAYLQALDDDAFRAAVPTLRRALADLGKTERRYLVETVLAVRGHARAGTAKEAARVVTEKDEAELRAVGEEIAKAMDDLDDLL